MIKEIDKYIDSKRDEMVETLKMLVNLEGKATELDNMDVLSKCLFELFTEAGMDCQLIAAHPKAPKVLAGIIGEDRPGEPILFSGHYDTVFVKGTFGDQPFKIEDGKAIGPGVLDMKGGIVIALYAIKALQEIGYKDRPIKLVICGDEEGGEHHSYTAEVIKDISKGCVCAFNMETSPISRSLCVGRKGIISGNFTVTGISAHSGNDFATGRNAIVEAAQKIIEIDKLTDIELGTNMNVSIISGGTIWNSIPNHCEVEFSGRCASQSEIDRVKGALGEIFKKTHIEGTSTSYIIKRAGKVFEKRDDNMELWDYCNKKSQELGYGELGHVFLGGGSDAVNIQEVGVPTLCSCGIIGEWNHTDREYALVDSLFSRAKFWCGVVIGIDEFAS